MREKLSKHERAKRALIRAGYLEDELAKLFTTEEDLLAFFAETQATAKAAKLDKAIKPEEEDDDEEEPVDSYHLSTEETAVLERQKELEAATTKHEVTEQDKAKFDAEAPKTLPSGEAAPDYADFMKSLEEGMAGDDTTVPNN